MKKLISGMVLLFIGVVLMDSTENAAGIALCLIGYNFIFTDDLDK